MALDFDMPYICFDPGPAVAMDSLPTLFPQWYADEPFYDSSCLSMNGIIHHVFRWCIYVTLPTAQECPPDDGRCRTLVESDMSETDDIQVIIFLLKTYGRRVEGLFRLSANRWDPFAVLHALLHDWSNIKYASMDIRNDPCMAFFVAGNCGRAIGLFGTDALHKQVQMAALMNDPSALRCLPFRSWADPDVMHILTVNRMTRRSIIELVFEADTDEKVADCWRRLSDCPHKGEWRGAERTQWCSLEESPDGVGCTHEGIIDTVHWSCCGRGFSAKCIPPDIGDVSVPKERSSRALYETTRRVLSPKEIMDEIDFWTSKPATVEDSSTCLYCGKSQNLTPCAQCNFGNFCDSYCALACTACCTFPI